MDRRGILSGLGATALAALAGAPATGHAQPASGRPTRFVVGYPAGGVADFAARTVVEAMNQTGASTAIVENRVGAAANIAMEYVARQPADAGVYGVFANSLLTTNAFVPQLMARNADPFKDMVPVMAISDMVLVLAVGAHLEIRTLDEFLAKARAPGARMRIGLAGVGTPHHLAALLLERTAALDLTLVPYKGGAPMMADAAGGHVDAVFTTIPVGGAMVAAGKMRWIAVVQPTAVQSLPGIPSLVPVFKGATIPSWIGAYAPAATPAHTVQAMHEAMGRVVNSPGVAAKLRANGLEPLSLSLADTRQRIDEEAAFMKDFLGKIKLDFAT